MTDRSSRREMTVFFHEDMLSYRIPDGVFEAPPSELLDQQSTQPEGPERILNTCAVLQRSPLADLLRWEVPRPATDDQILCFHTEPYLDQLKSANSGGHYFTATTYLPAGGLRAVRLSAGAAIAAARHVATGVERMAYALGRPPSHHAQPDTADGYCFVNGVALAALEAMEHGCARVAIIDWDVHHGNGTQEGFYTCCDVLTISIHMEHGAWGPSHTQTGGVEELGETDGYGFNINLPLPFGAGDACYTEVFERCVVPAVRTFGPDLIILANGQDANQFDPNGRQTLSMAGFYALGTCVRDLAKELCDGRIVVTQEGGYNPAYAPYCAYAVVAGLLGEALAIDDPLAFYPDDLGRARADVQALIDRHPLLA